MLARIHVDSWRAAYRELLPEATLQAFSYQWREECFRESLASGPEETYVFQLNGEIVGFLTLGAARDPDLDAKRTGEIWGIYLSAHQWRTGIGRELIGEGEKILRSRSFERVVLWVLENNRRARKFFEATGFVLDGESRPVDWGIPLRAVRYAKALKPVEAPTS